MNTVPTREETSQFEIIRLGVARGARDAASSESWLGNVLGQTKSSAGVLPRSEGHELTNGMRALYMSSRTGTKSVDVA